MYTDNQTNIPINCVDSMYVQFIQILEDKKKISNGDSIRLYYNRPNSMAISHLQILEDAWSLYANSMSLRHYHNWYI